MGEGVGATPGKSSFVPFGGVGPGSALFIPLVCQRLSSCYYVCIFHSQFHILSLVLDKAVASRVVIVIVSGLGRRAETLLVPAKYIKNGKR